MDCCTGLPCGPTKVLTDANYTVPLTENGYIYGLPAATAGRTITLPNPGPNGLSYVFRLNATAGGTPGNTWTITSGAANILGSAFGKAGATAYAIGTLKTNVVVDYTAANAVIGDIVEFRAMNGVWYVKGLSAGTANGFSFT